MTRPNRVEPREKPLVPEGMSGFFVLLFYKPGGVVLRKLLTHKTEGIILGVTVILFVIGALTGFLIAGQWPDFAQKMVASFTKALSHLTKLKGIHLALGIFLNNLRVCLLFLLIGAFLPPVPGLIVYQNGFFLGVLSWFTITIRDKTASHLILGLAPHGILELPAVFLAAAAGAYLGWEHWKTWAGCGQYNWAKSWNYALRWALIVTAILLPAALIEVFITPLFIGG